MLRFVCKKQNKKLMCKEAAKMVIPYIEGQLGEKDLRKFVTHVKECSECREELESYKVSELSSADERTINLFEEFVEAENFTNDMFKRLIKSIYVYDDRRMEIKWNYKEKEI